MADISTLLNPAPDGDHMSDSELETIPKPEGCSYEYGKSSQLRKRQKICKDAAVFTRGPVRGECRYPPHQYQDEMLAAQHQQFEVYPMGEIADYPRHIPYNSGKKFFFEKTGRESLEVFQYNFKMPGDGTQYAMLWDYNIGLVRTTPLFKCTGYSKTTPAKMLNRNPGLRDICHSITGGALVAQGYWMPYDAAKAVAATFCWNIRYALTPIFGTDFPTMCIPPDSEKFGDMIIDPSITRRCNEQANLYRTLEARTTSPPPTATSVPLTPDTPTYSVNNKKFRRKDHVSPNSDHSCESGSDDHCLSGLSTPKQLNRGLWTPVKTPRSIPVFPSPNFTFSQKSQKSLRSSRDFSSPELSPKSISYIARSKTLSEQRAEESGVDDGVSQAEYDDFDQILTDEKAAWLLLSLKLGDPYPREVRGTKRRAST